MHDEPSDCRRAGDASSWSPDRSARQYVGPRPDVDRLAARPRWANTTLGLACFRAVNAIMTSELGIARKRRDSLGQGHEQVSRLQIRYGAEPPRTRKPARRR